MDKRMRAYIEPQMNYIEIMNHGMSYQLAYVIFSMFTFHGYHDNYGQDQVTNVKVEVNIVF